MCSQSLTSVISWCEEEAREGRGEETGGTGERGKVGGGEGERERERERERPISEGSGEVK